MDSISLSWMSRRGPLCHQGQRSEARGKKFRALLERHDVVKRKGGLLNLCVAGGNQRQSPGWSTFWGVDVVFRLAHRRFETPVELTVDIFPHAFGTRLKEDSVVGLEARR